MTRAEMALWQRMKVEATEDLVRINAGGFTHIRLDSAFRVVSGRVGMGEFVVSEAFAEDFVSMNAEALTLGITVQLNQTFRRNGVAVHGAVVAPVSASQHLIGHGVDVNLLDPPSNIGFTKVSNGTETAAASSFVSAMKSHGLRWGGDWTRFDPFTTTGKWPHRHSITSPSFTFTSEPCRLGSQSGHGYYSGHAEPSLDTQAKTTIAGKTNSPLGRCARAAV